MNDQQLKLEIIKMLTLIQDEVKKYNPIKARKYDFWISEVEQEFILDPYLKAYLRNHALTSDNPELNEYILRLISK